MVSALLTSGTWTLTEQAPALQINKGACTVFICNTFADDERDENLVTHDSFITDEPSRRNGDPGYRWRDDAFRPRDKRPREQSNLRVEFRTIVRSVDLGEYLLFEITCR